MEFNSGFRAGMGRGTMIKRGGASFPNQVKAEKPEDESTEGNELIDKDEDPQDHSRFGYSPEFITGNKGVITFRPDPQWNPDSPDYKISRDVVGNCSHEGTLGYVKSIQYAKKMRSQNLYKPSFINQELDTSPNSPDKVVNLPIMFDIKTGSGRKKKETILEVTRKSIAEAIANGNTLFCKGRNHPLAYKPLNYLPYKRLPFMFLPQD